MLEGYGLMPSQAIKLFLHQIAETNRIPLSFDYQAIPSIDTLEEAACVFLDPLCLRQQNRYENGDARWQALDAMK